MGRPSIAQSGMSPVGWTPRRVAAVGGEPTAIAAMDFTAGEPYGWTAVESNPAYWDKFHRATDGPASRPAAEVLLIESGDSNQFYAGWNVSGFSAPTGPASRYVQMYFRVKAGWDALGQTNKMVILGDGGAYGASSRMIIEYRPNGSTPAVRLQRNIEGSPDRTSLVDLVVGQWHALQFEVTSSQTISGAVTVTSHDTATPTRVTTAASHGFSTGAWVVISGSSDSNINGVFGQITVVNATQFDMTGFTTGGGTGGTVRSVSTDAVFKVWRDSDVYASPTATSSAGAKVVPFDWNNLACGYFHNEVLPVGDALAYQWAAMRYTDTFDNGFFARM